MRRSPVLTKVVLAAGLSASLAMAPATNASVDLIARGSLSGNASDLSTETAAPLENGVEGNLLGGIGSGFAYAGCGIFLAIPDRGPNAVAYNAGVSDTASYINRFQTIQMSLAPSAGPLPFALAPTLTATTLLQTAQRLVYGDGSAGGTGFPDGTPALNQQNHTNYFTGRSDNFAAAQLSTYALDARFDPESIRVSNDGTNVFVSDEYGPYVYRFNRKTGLRTAVFHLPDSFAISHLSAVGDDEISGNTSGRVANKGMEGLAISPNGTTLFGAMQSPLLQDGGTNAAYARIVKIDLATGATTFQYAYPLTNIGTASKPKYPTISEIVAINDHEFLIDERDGKGLGDNSTAVFKQLYRVDLTGAQDVSAVSGAASLAPLAVAKTLFLDLVANLNSHGIASTDIPAKLEGVAFGPDIEIGDVVKHTLFIANDNDFVGTITDSNHPDGIDNPNQFFVFGVDESDLPSYAPQLLVNRTCR